MEQNRIEVVFIKTNFYKEQMQWLKSLHQLMLEHDKFWRKKTKKTTQHFNRRFIQKRLYQIFKNVQVEMDIEE